MKKKIAIDIDFIIRDWVAALIGVYQKQIDENWNEDIHMSNGVELWENFKFPVYTYADGETFDPEISESIVIVDKSKENKPNKEYFNKFLIDNVLEIFGHAKESIPNVISFLNEFYRETKDKYELSFVSKIGGKGRPSTLFFLSKCGSEIPNVSFIQNYEELKGRYDYIFTGNNIEGIDDVKIINVKHKYYDKYDSGNLLIDSIKEIKNLEIN